MLVHRSLNRKLRVLEEVNEKPPATARLPVLSVTRSAVPACRFIYRWYIGGVVLLRHNNKELVSNEYEGSYQKLWPFNPFSYSIISLN